MKKILTLLMMGILTLSCQQKPKIDYLPSNSIYNLNLPPIRRKGHAIQ
jgi:hypothetical protein